jgi:serine/threonine protein kinase
MEKGGDLLGDYINTVPFDDNQKLFLKIYNSLFIIEDKLKINFKHNDFKENNILVSPDGKPMLIDFGFCEFNIDTISFNSLYKPHENFDSKTHFGYNIIHDMMQLITSLYNSPGATIIPYNIFKFIKNENTNILDTDMLIKYLILKFPDTFRDEKILFYKTTNLLNSINILRPDELAYLKKMFLTFYDKGIYNFIDDKVKISFLKDISIFITPTELADNIGIPLPSEDDSFGKFEKKYKKYKMKYLKLKNSFL